MLSVQSHILSLLLLLFFFFSQKKQQQEYIIHGYAQGTDYTIKYFAPDSVVTKAAVDSILAVIDSSMSLYKPYSLICRFNAADKGLALDRHFVKVMRRSFEIYKDTRGKFDITVAPLVQAWGFGAKPVKNFPDSASIAAILPCVGMSKLTMKAAYLKKDKPCVQVDLNGIAQGYSVDVVAGYLLQRKVSSFVVEIGGELRINGPKPDGKSMKIGIEGPAESANAEPVIRHVIGVNSGAVTTSGNYRKFLQKGARKAMHLIDPKTGYPLRNAMISVTVYAKDAITADGYDNAIMAMDVEEALNFIAARKGLEAYIIYRKKDGSIADTLSAGFKKMIVD